MSRVGKVPVLVPEGVKIDLGVKGQVTVDGALGQLSLQLPSEIEVVSRDKDDKSLISIFIRDKHNEHNPKVRALWGLFRTLIANMVEGVSKGFSKTLEIIGVGYKAAVSGQIVSLYLGFSHEILYVVPEAITVKCEKANMLTISGIDKQLVGQIAAEIRQLKKVEPYKGKGINYLGAWVRRKEVKKESK